LAGFPDLTAAQLYDALSYYYTTAEIDADIEADELSEVLNKFNLEINADESCLQKLAPQYVQGRSSMIRLYIDEDVGSVGSALRQRSYDVNCG